MLENSTLRREEHNAKKGKGYIQVCCQHNCCVFGFVCVGVWVWGVVLLGCCVVVLGGWVVVVFGVVFVVALGVGDGQGSLVRCSPWGH